MVVVDSQVIAVAYRHRWRHCAGPARAAEKPQQVPWSTCFHNPGHITAAFSALAHQQQRTTLDHAGEVLDSDRVPAADTPNIGQQQQLAFCTDGRPQLGRRWREFRYRLQTHHSSLSVQAATCRQRQQHLIKLKDAPRTLRWKQHDDKLGGSESG